MLRVLYLPGAGAWQGAVGEIRIHSLDRNDTGYWMLDTGKRRGSEIGIPYPASSIQHLASSNQNTRE
jgi:hypothetical protein